MKKFVSGIALGMVLMAGTSLFAQREREFHPRLASAIAAVRDARAYLFEAPHDFGGHKQAAVRACDEAIRQMELARAYRPR